MHLCDTASVICLSANADQVHVTGYPLELDKRGVSLAPGQGSVVTVTGNRYINGRTITFVDAQVGVDTVDVFAEERFLVSHMMFASQVYVRMVAARFDTLDLGAAMQMDWLAPAAAETVKQ